MSFSSEPSKQAQEVVFFGKLRKINYLSSYSKNNPIEQISPQKHLGIILDAKLNLQEHIKNLLTKVKKTL